MSPLISKYFCAPPMSNLKPVTISSRINNLSFEDAIKIESLLINAGKGSPLIDFFNAYLDSKKDNHNYFDSINSNLINIGGRLGDVMDVIQESSSLDSESGKSISKIERDKIHKAIMLLEEKIKNLNII